jgi:hypothetical protein
METFVLIAWYMMPGTMNAAGTSTRGEYADEAACVEAGESLKLEKELWNFVCIPKKVFEKEQQQLSPSG